MTRFAILLSLLLGLLGSPITWACSCVANDPASIRSVREYYDYADVVFLGKVEETDSAAVQDGGYVKQIQTTTLFVLRSWKGEKSNRIITRIDTQCCICGYSFSEGETHLIFAYETKDGYYTTSICSMSMPESRANDTIALLDEIASGE